MEKIFVYLTNLSSNVAYLIIFGILVACGLGFPIPEDIPLIATGYLIWDETMDWFPAIAATMAGVLIGDTILFAFGRRMGRKILERERLQTLFSPSKIRRTRAYFRKYGDKIVFFARFVAGFRAVAFFMAGTMKMKYRRFIFLDSIAALLSVPIWIGIGYALGNYLGDEISQILRSVKHLKNAFTALVLVVTTVVLVRAYLKYKKTKKLQSALRHGRIPKL